MTDDRFQLTSSAFAADERIPRRHTCDGEDVAPPLRWSGAPAGARSFALVMDDPDAPNGTFTHWLLWDIPGDATELDPAASLPSGRNDFDKPGYGGPCPPRGHGVHRYRFQLFALDRDELGIDPGSSRHAMEDAMAGHVLADTVLQGRYERS